MNKKGNQSLLLPVAERVSTLFGCAQSNTADIKSWSQFMIKKTDGTAKEAG